jgi:hypothetical protein
MQFRYYDLSKGASADNSDARFDLTGATRWLSGEERRIASDVRLGQPAKERISPQLAGELTKQFLGLVSQQAKRYFTAGMPEGYTLPTPKTQIALLDQLPHLGWCSFASVPLTKPNGDRFAIRFHWANFYANINTAPGEKFFQLQSPKRSQMFFGVAFCPDENSKSGMRVDRSVHHSGVSFITNDPLKALNNAVILRTGLSLAGWQKMTEERAKKQAEAA